MTLRLDMTARVEKESAVPDRLAMRVVNRHTIAAGSRSEPERKSGTKQHRSVWKLQRVPAAERSMLSEPHVSLEPAKHQDEGFDERLSA